MTNNLRVKCAEKQTRLHDSGLLKLFAFIEKGAFGAVQKLSTPLQIRYRVVDLVSWDFQSSRAKPLDVLIATFLASLRPTTFGEPHPPFYLGPDVVIHDI